MNTNCYNHGRSTRTETIVNSTAAVLPCWNRRRWLTATVASLALPGQAQPRPAAEWVVGQSLPLSGPMAPTLNGLTGGAQLAFDEVNRQGGIEGRPLRLVQLDDGFDPARTAANVRQLVTQAQAVALLGTVGTAQTAAALPVIAELRTPMIGPYTGSPALRARHNPYLFTTQASYTDELVQMVRYLQQVQFKRLAIVYQANEFGTQMLPLVQKIVAAEGGSVTAALPLEAAGVDAKTVADAAYASQPQAVLMIVAGPAVVPFVKSSHARKGIPLYTLSLSVGSAILAALGADAYGLAVARVTPYPWRATTPLARGFQQAMERAGKPIDYDHYAGYINARVLIEGLRAAGRAPTGESVAQGLTRLGTVDLQGYKLSYGPGNHHGSDFVEIAVVGKDGRFLR